MQMVLYLNITKKIRGFDMVTISDFNMDLLKDEMKEAKILRTSTVAFIEKRFKDKGQYNLLQRELGRNALLIHLYSPSKTIPVNVGGLVINYKLYTSFMKKLKDFITDEVIQDHKFVITYKKLGSSSKGVLEFEDLSSYFQGFVHVPIAEFF
jgi:hypothetical protein